MTGDAWFDHQWGDFISVGGGGWDWFAVNLDDGTDLTLSLVRAADGTYPLVYGTLVAPTARPATSTADAFIVESTDRWTSPTTGRRLPGRLDDPLPSEGLEIVLRADGRPAGARHAGHDRGRVLGGIAGRHRDGAADRPSAGRHTSS